MDRNGFTIESESEQILTSLLNDGVIRDAYVHTQIAGAPPIPEDSPPILTRQDNPLASQVPHFPVTLNPNEVELDDNVVQGPGFSALLPQAPDPTAGTVSPFLWISL